MKILICSTRMGIGGAETHVLTLARAMTALGHRVTVASSGGEYVDQLTGSGIDHVLLPLDKKDPASVIRSRNALLKLAVEQKYDVVAAHGRIPAFICGRLRRDPAFPPLVVTAHGFFRDNFLLDKLSEWGCHTIAVSDDVRDHLTEKFGLSDENITVIRNGVDLNVPPHVASGEIRITAASRLDGDTARTALMLCELMPTLKKKFPELPLRLVIVGGGSRLSDVREAARNASVGCPGLVTVTGGLTDMPSVYARTDIFVGASRAAMEAMAAGVPVLLCSDTGCAGVLDETNIRRAETVNFTCRGEKKTDTALLMEGLVRLLSMTARERSNLGRFGRKYISVYGGAETMARQTLAVYSEMIARYKGGIMLCGSFGRGNIGDDAALSAVLGVTAGIAPGVVPTVPAPARADLPEGVSRIGRFRLFALRRELRRTRLFILCGGSLLQNSTSTRSLWYYARLTELAAKFGARVMIWGGGVGPITGEKARLMAACTAEYADEVCLRDPDSMNVLEKMGVDTSGMNVTADAAMTTLPEPLRPGISLKNNEYFAVSVRPLAGLAGCDAEKEEQILSAIAGAVTGIFDTYHIVPVWIPYAPEDEKLIKKLSVRCGAGVIMPRMTPGETVSVLSGCVFALGLRLHQSVFASCAGIPSLGIAYDPKVAAFAAYAKQPPALNPDARNFSSKQIIQTVGRLLQILPRAKEMIRGQTVVLRAKCKETAAVAADLYRYDLYVPAGDAEDEPEE